MQAHERRSKSNADHPSRTISPVLQEVAVHLDFSGDSEAAKVVSGLLEAGQIPWNRQGRVLVDKDLLKDRSLTVLFGAQQRRTQL
jgi:hypothetical protein